MPLVRTTNRAVDLNTGHTIADILGLGNCALVHGRGETRPASARIIFFSTTEERCVAAHATVQTNLFFIVIRIVKRTLSTLLTCHVILDFSETLLPFRIRTNHREAVTTKIDVRGQSTGTSAFADSCNGGFGKFFFIGHDRSEEKAANRDTHDGFDAKNTGNEVHDT